MSYKKERKLIHLTSIASKFNFYITHINPYGEKWLNITKFEVNHEILFENHKIDKFILAHKQKYL